MSTSSILKTMVYCFAVGLAATPVLFDFPSDKPAPGPHLPYASGNRSVFATGIVKGNSDEVELRSEINGRIQTVFVKENQFVQKGDLILEIENTEYRCQAAICRSEVQKREAELEKLMNGARDMERDEVDSLHKAALAELKRMEKTWNAVQGLKKNNSATVEEVDHYYFRLQKLKAEVRAAKSRLELIEAKPRSEDVDIARALLSNAKAQLKLAENRLKKTQIIAPLDGRIIDFNALEGEITGPNSLEPLAIVADTTQFFVEAHLEEYDALAIQLGQTAKISADGFRNPIQGSVVSLSPHMKRKEISSLKPNEFFDVKIRKIKLKVEASSELIVGLPVDVSFD